VRGRGKVVMRYSVAAAVLIILAGIACSQDGFDKSQFQQFESESSDYRLALPEGWVHDRTLDSPSGRIETFAHANEEGDVTGTLSVSVRMEDERAGLDFEEFSQQVLASVGAVERLDDREVAGEQAVVYKDAAVRGGSGLQTEAAFLRHGTAVWGLTLTYQTSEGDSFSGLFDPILDEFSFL